MCSTLREQGEYEYFTVLYIVIVRVVGFLTAAARTVLAASRTNTVLCVVYSTHAWMHAFAFALAGHGPAARVAANGGPSPVASVGGGAPADGRHQQQATRAPGGRADPPRAPTAARRRRLTCRTPAFAASPVAAPSAGLLRPA